MVFVEPAWSFVDNGAGGPGLGNPTPFQPGGPAYTSEISFGKRPPAPLKVWNPWTQLTSVSLWRGLWGPRLLSVFPTKPPGLPAPRWVPATLHSTERLPGHVCAGLGSARREGCLEAAQDGLKLSWLLSPTAPSRSPQFRLKTPDSHHLCRYKDYREPPWSEHKYDISKDFWAVLAARLAFVIVFQVRRVPCVSGNFGNRGIEEAPRGQNRVRSWWAPGSQTWRDL